MLVRIMRMDKMSVKEHLEMCFDKKLRFWKETFNSNPKIPYIAEIDNNIFIEGTVDDEGYAQWLPIMQTRAIDFVSFENKLGFKLHEQMKEYLSSHWFLELIGRMANDITIYFNKVSDMDDIYSLLFSELNADTYLITRGITSGRKLLLIGMATIKGDDSNAIYFDNETAEMIFINSDNNILSSGWTLEEMLGLFESVF